MSGNRPDYAVITPVRDEVRNLPRTAASMLAQTEPPARWLIVDDGSTDGTRELAESLAAEHDWISVISAGPRSGTRARGGPIVRAFERGLATFARRPEVVVKMDADLELPPDCYERLMDTFASDPRAGVAGALVMNEIRGTLKGDVRPEFVHGALKAYRTACLEDFGGLRASMGWDGIDEYAARARGWRVRVLEDVVVIHFGRRGAKQPWHKARFEEGVANHYMGYLPSFLALRVVYRMAVEAPPVLGGLAIGAGFVHSRLTRLPRVDDPLAIAQLRSEQRARIRSLVRRPTTPSRWRAQPAAATRTE